MASPVSTTALVTSTSASASTTTADDVYALTTTFTPPARCTDTARMFSMLSSPQYYVWANEPMPVSSSTVSSCYPNEWIKHYNTAGSYSSSVPAMSPLVCPLSWTTVMTAPGNYIACCPQNFTGVYPTSTVDAYRPMYGGTCYSDVSVGQTIAVSAYNNQSLVATSNWPVTATSAQVYAHPIDGYAMQAQQTIFLTGSNNTTQTPSLATSASTSSSSVSSLSGGAIAGVVIGVVAGILLLASFLFFLLKRRRRTNQEDDPPEMYSPPLDSKDLHEIHSNERSELSSSKIDAIGFGELHGKDKAHELEGRGPAELDAGEVWTGDVKN